jgi:hypothetical protein
MSGDGWDGEAARCQAPWVAGVLGPSESPGDGVKGGDAGGKEHGGQNHQEDEDGQQHDFTYISPQGIGDAVRHLPIRD